MACCKPCCGCQDCSEGQAGKCCCGGAEGTCCQPGEYCCNGACGSAPCDLGACCFYEYNPSNDTYLFVGCSDTTYAGCSSGSGQYAVFKPGTSCADDPDPCAGNPAGTCCSGSGGCLTGGPGPACVPFGAPGDDGCFCDSACYTVCFDCCGADAVNCCTPKPTLESLWDNSAGPGLQMIDIGLLETGMLEYGIDLNEAWHAATQSGTVLDGGYVTHGFARVSLIICLQDMESGAQPWVAQQAHRVRVIQAASAMRSAAQ